MNRANIGMIQRGCRLRLKSKTSQRLRVMGNLFGQEFQRYKSMQPRVLSLIHHSHAATTKLFDNAVVRDGSPDHGVRILLLQIGQVNAGATCATAVGLAVAALTCIILRRPQKSPPARTLVMYF